VAAVDSIVHKLPVHMCPYRETLQYIEDTLGHRFPDGVTAELTSLTIFLKFGDKVDKPLTLQGRFLTFFLLFNRA
jgi:hypothetical protein